MATGILDVYDPATNTWATKATMPTARFEMAGRVINGFFYVVGGDQQPAQDTGALEVYDPAMDSWATKASMPTQRNGLDAGVINSIL